MNSIVPHNPFYFTNFNCDFICTSIETNRQIWDRVIMDTLQQSQTKKRWTICKVLFHTINKGSLFEKSKTHYPFFNILLFLKPKYSNGYLNEDPSHSRQPHAALTSWQRTFKQEIQSSARTQLPTMAVQTAGQTAFGYFC